MVDVPSVKAVECTTREDGPVRSCTIYGRTTHHVDAETLRIEESEVIANQTGKKFKFDFDGECHYSERYPGRTERLFCESKS